MKRDQARSTLQHNGLAVLFSKYGKRSEFRPNEKKTFALGYLQLYLRLIGAQFSAVECLSISLQ